MDQDASFEFRIRNKSVRNEKKKPAPPRGTRQISVEEAYKLVIAQNPHALAYLKDK